MSLCFVLDRAAFEQPEARWTIAQVAPLLDAPWRLAPEGAATGDDELVVWVGGRDRAPQAAAAIVPFADWPRWEPAALGLGTFDRAPLVCPGGACPPPELGRELPAAWLRSIFFLLSREEEVLDPRRDSWECFSGFYTRLHEMGVLGRPLVNLHAAQLRSRLDAGARAQGRTLERAPRWKNGARFAAAITHDVDDVRLYSGRQAWRLLRLARSPRDYAFRGGLTAMKRALLHRGGDPYSAFDRWVAEEERRGFRSTFYVCPPRPSPRHEYDAMYTLDDRLSFGGARVTVAEMLRSLHGRGFEIGLHGSYLSHRRAAELARQKRQIEEGLGAPVDGIRQHFLRFDASVTWQAQEEAGFACDSTLGYNETPGFRAGIAAPFLPWNLSARRPHRLLELPLTCMDGALFRSLGLHPEAAVRATLEHLDQVEAAGGLAGLLWHPNVAAVEHFPGWWDCWVAALDRLGERGAWVAPSRDIAAWWTERSRQLALEPATAG